MAFILCEYDRSSARKRQSTSTFERVPHRVLDRSKRGRFLSQCARYRSVLEYAVGMLLQVPANPGEIPDDVDPVGIEVIGWADPGKHEQLGAGKRAGTQHDLPSCSHRPQLAAVPILDTDGTRALEDHSDG
jgi:hypothetical protein